MIMSALTPLEREGEWRCSCDGLTLAQEGHGQAVAEARAGLGRRACSGNLLLGELAIHDLTSASHTADGQQTMTVLWLRLSVWWRRHGLTEALAAGADPDAGADLTVIARDLIGMRARQRLAAAVDGRLRAATQRNVPWSPAVPIDRRQIADAHDEPAKLAERLRAPRPVPAHAVARVAMLLSDGTGPLSRRTANWHAWDLVRTARLALDDPIV